MTSALGLFVLGVMVGGLSVPLVWWTITDWTNE